MNDREREKLLAFLDGVTATLEVMKQAELARIAQRSRVRPIHFSQPRRQESKYDWTDWVCGNPLWDKIMGIK